MPFFTKQNIKNEELVVNVRLIENSRKIVDEVHGINKKLMELRSLNNPFIPTNKIDELIAKYSECRLPKQLHAVLNQKTLLLGAKLSDQEITAKLYDVFTKVKNDDLTATVDEIQKCFGLVLLLNASIIENEEPLLSAIREKNDCNESEIKSVMKIKELDIFMKNLVDSNAIIVPAIKENLSMTKDYLGSKKQRSGDHSEKHLSSSQDGVAESAKSLGRKI